MFFVIACVGRVLHSSVCCICAAESLVLVIWSR
jgi:hypothetical protein